MIYPRIYNIEQPQDEQIKEEKKMAKKQKGFGLLIVQGGDTFHLVTISQSQFVSTYSAHVCSSVQLLLNCHTCTVAETDRRGTEVIRVDLAKEE
jgi:hypothetical protein